MSFARVRDINNLVARAFPKFHREKPWERGFDINTYSFNATIYRLNLEIEELKVLVQTIMFNCFNSISQKKHLRPEMQANEIQCS